MAKLFVITGHGAGDSGAVGNGHTEAERVRALAIRMKVFGGDEVIVSESNRNYYKDKGISNLTFPKGQEIVELHLDSATASARGGHIILKEGQTPDSIDNALADFITKLFPGRSEKIKYRNLGNANRAEEKGYNYRLVECCFISNRADLEAFNEKVDEIAKGILKCFGIEPKQAQKATVNTGKSLEAWAREVINGKHGNGHENRAKSLANSGCQYSYEQVKAKVNEVLGKKLTNSASPVVKPATPTKSIADWAKEVIDGKHGNGHTNRENSLKKAGCPYDYSEVRKKVNELLK